MPLLYSKSTVDLVYSFYTKPATIETFNRQLSAWQNPKNPPSYCQTDQRGEPLRRQRGEGHALPWGNWGKQPTAQEPPPGGGRDAWPWTTEPPTPQGRGRPCLRPGHRLTTAPDTDALWRDMWTSQRLARHTPLRLPHQAFRTGEMKKKPRIAPGGARAAGAMSQGHSPGRISDVTPRDRSETEHLKP